VADDDCALPAQRDDEVGRVVDERRQVVWAAELGVAVAPQVGGDGAVPGLGERRELVPPRAPELWEPVQAEDERPVGRPVGERVEGDSVRVEDERLDTWLSRTAVGESSHNRPNGHLAGGAARLYRRRRERHGRPPRGA
jgi:hypothetical protein